LRDRLVLVLVLVLVLGGRRSILRHWRPLVAMKEVGGER
jgi:hypothetical protein